MSSISLSFYTVAAEIALDRAEVHVAARRLFLGLICVVALAACVTRLAPAPSPWSQRLVTLQNSHSWQLDGRAAVVVGAQGWQATLNWRQDFATSEVHIAGPFGVGAVALTSTPNGLSINGAPAGEAETALLRSRLGLELPLDHLRYWLLGIPDPGSGFEIRLNAQDRSAHLTQADWLMDYDRYMPVSGDWLPAHLVLQHLGVRVKISVDRWEIPP